MSDNLIYSNILGLNVIYHTSTAVPVPVCMRCSYSRTNLLVLYSCTQSTAVVRPYGCTKFSTAVQLYSRTAVVVLVLLIATTVAKFSSYRYYCTFKYSCSRYRYY